MTADSATDAISPIRNQQFLATAMMEYWERFAMYGVKSLLLLILLDHILVGNLSHVAGATAIRDASAALFGPVSATGLASQIYGYTNALLYLSIPLGGLIGDLIGDRRLAVTGGGAGMLIGLMLMLHEQSFLIGLIPFAVGTGVLKGNLSAQVGMLFRNEDQRRRGYTIYLGFLNAGVICGPLICGLVATFAGPTKAIAVAALALIIGLIFYMRSGGGRDGESMPIVDTQPEPNVASLPRTAMLVVALAAVYLCFAAYEQLGNIFLVWARARVDLRLMGWTMPVGWFLSLDGAVTLLLIAGWQMAQRMLERYGIRVSALTQILCGGLLCAAGNVLLSIGSAAGGTLSLPWALTYLVLVDAAIVLLWPAGLSLMAGLAPRRLVGFWMGLFYLHGFFAHLWVGLSGVYYERMATPLFWLLQAAVAGAGALIILLVGLPLMRIIRARQATTISA